jgi:hypothetical protein
MGRRKGVGWYSDKTFGEETIKGRTFEVKVNSDGEFYAEVDGDVVKSPVLRTLRAKIGHSIAREPLNIPFIVVDKYFGKSMKHKEISKGVITGIHSRTGAFLLKSEDGSTDQKRCYSDSYLNADTDVAELKRLRAAQKKATDELEKFMKANKLDTDKIKAQVRGTGQEVE